jgi:hypothetical protein
MSHSPDSLKTRVMVTPALSALASVIVAFALSFLATLELWLPSHGLRVFNDAAQSAELTLRAPPSSIANAGPGESIFHQSVAHPRHTSVRGSDVDAQRALRYHRDRVALRHEITAGTFLITLAVMGLLWSALQLAGGTRSRLARSHLGLMVLLVGQAAMAKGLLLFTALPVMWVPATAVALWVSMAFDRRTALHQHI